MKADHIVEYQIYEYDDTFFFTESYEEAMAYFEEGRVVYEVHTFRAKAEWTTTFTTVSHEWR